ncbi:MAG TPA: hypothetical protein VFX30_07420 [bacterium]|nr:hypothetical protein [bacterium]
MSLRELGDSLRTYFNESPRDLDVGLPATVWFRAGSALPEAPPRVETRGAGDSDVSLAEIFQEAFRELSDSGGRGSEGLLRLFRGRPEAIPPWVLDDGDATTRSDRNLRTTIDRIVRRERREAREDNRLLLLGLIRALHLPRSDGGLGLRYEAREDGSHWHFTGIEAFERGAGDCNSFSFLFYALCAHAGLRPTFIRIAAERNLDTGSLEGLNHVGVAVALDPEHPENFTAVDPSLGLILSGREREWYSWTLNEMLANHLRNQAFSNVPAGLEGEAALAWQEARLLEAFEIAPYNFEIAASVAAFYRDRRSDSAAASRFAERAAELNPSGIGFWSGPPTHP